MRTSHTGLHNQHGGFVLPNPLPPLGTILVAHPLPFLISTEGLLPSTAAGEAQSAEFPGGVIPLEALEKIRAVGRKLCLGNAAIAKVASAALARHWARQLRKLSQLAPEQRSKEIRSLLYETVDTQGVESRWREFSLWRRPLAWLCNGLWIYLFVAAPLIVHAVGLKQSWASLLAGLIVLTSFIAWRYRRAHQALYPDADEERFTHSLTMLLAPTSAIRALDTLSRPLLERSHPLALAQRFSSPEYFFQMARRVWAELQYPEARRTAEVSAAVIQERRRMEWRVVVEDFLRRNKIDPAELARAPARLDESCHSYCPRCLAQFIHPSGQCADCGGIALVPFDPKSVT